VAGRLQGCCRPAIKIIRMVDALELSVAILTFATALCAFGTGLRNARKLDSQHGTLGEIRVNVNGRLDALLARTEQLAVALAAAGQPIPPSRTTEEDERKI
jgi:hypothetical protein